MPACPLRTHAAVRTSRLHDRKLHKENKLTGHLLGFIHRSLAEGVAGVDSLLHSAALSSSRLSWSSCEITPRSASLTGPTLNSTSRPKHNHGLPYPKHSKGPSLRLLWAATCSQPRDTTKPQSQRCKTLQRLVSNETKRSAEGNRGLRRVRPVQDANLTSQGPYHACAMELFTQTHNTASQSLTAMCPGWDWCTILKSPCPNTGASQRYSASHGYAISWQYFGKFTEETTGSHFLEGKQRKGNIHTWSGFVGTFQRVVAASRSPFR